MIEVREAGSTALMVLHPTYLGLLTAFYWWCHSFIEGNNIPPTLFGYRLPRPRYPKNWNIVLRKKKTFGCKAIPILNQRIWETFMWLSPIQYSTWNWPLMMVCRTNHLPYERKNQKKAKSTLAIMVMTSWSEKGGWLVGVQFWLRMMRNTWVRSLFGGLTSFLRLVTVFQLAKLANCENYFLLSNLGQLY